MGPATQAAVAMVKSRRFKIDVLLACGGRLPPEYGRQYPSTGFHPESHGLNPT
jgi:hypothetical protein